MSMGPNDFGGGGGGLLGSGGFYGGMARPNGPYGPWAGCGCSSIVIMMAGFLLVFGGCLRLLGQ